MTLAEIEAAARALYNATGDTNWSSAELATNLYMATLEMTSECGLVIEKRFQSTTVAGTGEYAFPTYASSIKRVTYNGAKLKEIDMRTDDALTIENQLTTDTGVPVYYYVWERTINLRPLPSDALTLEVFATCDEQSLSPSSTLETPAMFHGRLVEYVVAQMAAKDLNWQMYDRFMERWEKIHKPKITAQIRRAKRGDAFAIVKMEEQLPTSTLGVK